MRRLVFLCAILILCTISSRAQTTHDRINARRQVMTDRFVNRLFIIITGATPDVSLGNAFKTNNGGVTTITNFLNGVDTQQVDVLCGDGNTTIQNNANIALTGGTNFTCVINVGISFRYDASQTKWVQFGGTGSGGGGSGCIPGAPTNSLQKNSGAGTCVASSIVDNGTNVTISEPVIASSGGTLNGTFAGSPTFSKTGNEAIKPSTPNDPIQYVSANGNDANDGLSVGSAKLTVYAALQALPNGAAGTAGGGTVILSGTVNYGGPLSPNQGMWLLSNNDPNFGSPPTGWLKRANGVSLTLDCLASITAQGHGHLGNCTMNGGNSADNVHPAVWISGGAGNVAINNISFQNYLNTYVKYGIDSNNNRNGTGGSSGFSMTNVGWNHGACQLGGGPGMDIGAQSFWVWLKELAISGCQAQVFQVASGAGASRSSNVVTITTTAAQNVAANDLVTIANVLDDSFNGSYIVASRPDSTHFTYSQIGANVSSGTGQVITAGAAAINIDAGPTGSGVGLIFIDDINLNVGNIRLRQGTNGSGLYVRNVSYEGNGSGPPIDAPTVLITATSNTSQCAGTNIRVENVEVSDPIAPIPAVQVDNASGCTDNVIVSRIAGSLRGRMTVLGGGIPTPKVTALRQGQYGLQQGQITATGIDVARRGFSPIVAPALNIAVISPANWLFDFGPGTITSGIAAPDGTSNAGRVTGSAVPPTFVSFYQGAISTTVGDVYVFGVWVRSVTANGYPSTYPIKFILNASGGGVGDTCVGGGSSGTGSGTVLGNTLGSYQSDGQWQWYSGVCKIATNPTTAQIRFDGSADSTHTSDFYGPVVMLFPAGTKSDNEVYEIANNLSSFPETAAVGDIAILKGHSLNLTGGTLTLANEVLTTSPRSPLNVLFPGALTTTWTGETWTLDKAITVTRVQAQLKTAPSGCSTAAIARLTDGSTPINLTLSAAANDSGVITQNYGAGAVLTAAIQTAASGCTTSPGDANLVVQYRMQ